MSWKEDYIKLHGEEAYEKRLERMRDWYKGNSKKKLAHDRARMKNHPEVVTARGVERNRKNGKYYMAKRKYQMTGIQHEREIMRKRHQSRWRQFKQIIAPGSQLHHSWRPNSAEYDGLALVEADAHMRGFIDVIQILEGDITLFTEEEVRNRGGQIDK